MSSDRWERWLFQYSFQCSLVTGVGTGVHVYDYAAPHVRDLIEHPQYEPDGRIPW